MDTLTLIIAPVLVVLISIWFSKKNNVKRTLPGPIGLPIVGYIPFLTKRPYEKFLTLAKTYGPVYSLRMCGRNIVVLCDYKSIKEAFSSDAFMGRPPDLPVEISETSIQTGALLDIPWTEQRTFSMHMFNEFCVEKTGVEERIKQEILELMELIERNKDTPFQITEFLASSVLNNITSFLFGKVLKCDDPKRKKLDKNINEVEKFASFAIFQTFFPWLARLLNFLKMGHKEKLRKALRNITWFVRDEIHQHEASFNPNNIRDFIDGYLMEIQKRKYDLNSTFHKDTLEDLARYFFGAGGETVRITVEWMLTICAAAPNIQNKIYKEIDDVVGRYRFPSYQDRHKMPYTEAAILEIMRWKTITPITPMRYTLVDTELNGYFIPKHSSVLAVLWSVDHDENIWGKDVNKYKPERFLNNNGTSVVKPEYFIPFSIGQRSCPGKVLAEMEIFLYVTAMLQKFKLSMPKGEKADLRCNLGTGFQPKRQKLMFHMREV